MLAAACWVLLAAAGWWSLGWLLVAGFWLIAAGFCLLASVYVQGAASSTSRALLPGRGLAAAHCLRPLPEAASPSAGPSSAQGVKGSADAKLELGGGVKEEGDGDGDGGDDGGASVANTAGLLGSEAPENDCADPKYDWIKDPCQS